MKIATVTEDGTKLSSHFGVAPSYRIFTIEEGKIIKDEVIDKPHHKEHQEHGGHHNHDHHGHHGGHGGMKFFDVIKDCDVLFAGGMGEPAYKRALSFGFEVIMTGGNIEAAVESYLNGDLVSDQRRVHSH